MEYYAAVEDYQRTEYPYLQGKTYLDHGGTTIYAKSLIDQFAKDLGSNLYGNPHSACTPAKLSGQVVDETRERTLRFFGADPDDFDLIFVANATAAIKLVMECFKDLASMNIQGGGEGFWYGYHVDAHNSLVGVRECTSDTSHLFRSDSEVEQWLSGSTTLNQTGKLGLFAYPGQSNFNGRRLPLNWSGRLRASQIASQRDTYSLLDAAALATSHPLHSVFKDAKTAPDFTALSFYKIFGFPDLGGLIVRKDSGNILKFRKYFGGGTVALVTVLDSKPWYESRDTLHAALEDGTLPFHSIIALGTAISTHERLYGPNPMLTISRHTSYLGKRLYEGMVTLRHGNGVPVCSIYKGPESTYGDSSTQGATISFNVVRPNETYVPYESAVETFADKKNIFVRSGQLCNPGGVASHLGYEKWHIQRLWSYGYKCGEHEDEGTEVYHGRPTGVVRVSLGAMSTIANVDTFINFLRETFLVPSTPVKSPKRESFVLPAFSIPPGVPEKDKPHRKIQSPPKIQREPTFPAKPSTRLDTEDEYEYAGKQNPTFAQIVKDLRSSVVDEKSRTQSLITKGKSEVTTDRAGNFIRHNGLDYAVEEYPRSRSPSLPPIARDPRFLGEFRKKDEVPKRDESFGDEHLRGQSPSLPQMVKKRQESIADRVENFMQANVADEDFKDGQSQYGTHLLPLMFREKDGPVAQSVDLMYTSAGDSSHETTSSSAGRLGRSRSAPLAEHEKGESSIVNRIDRLSSENDEDDDSIVMNSQVDLSYCQAYEFMPRSPRPYIRSAIKAHSEEFYQPVVPLTEHNKVPIIHTHIGPLQSVYRTVERPQRKQSKSLKRFFVPKEAPVRRSSSRLTIR